MFVHLARTIVLVASKIAKNSASLKLGVRGSTTSKTSQNIQSCQKAQNWQAMSKNARNSSRMQTPSHKTSATAVAAGAAARWLPPLQLWPGPGCRRHQISFRDLGLLGPAIHLVTNPRPLTAKQEIVSWPSGRQGAQLFKL